MPIVEVIRPSGGGSSLWEPIAWDALGQVAAALADRTNMSNGAVEPFADAGDVTLVNAAVSGGYVAPTASNVVPAMTSANTPTGYVVAASSFTTGYDPYKGANRVYGDPYNQWVSLSGSLPQWWSINFPSSVYGLRYRIKSVNYTEPAYAWPTAWQLQGWNGSAWVTLDTRSGQAPGSTTWFPDYTIAAPGRYSAYRMYFTASSNAGIVHMDEFELYAADAATITLNPINVSGATAGKIVFRASNEEATAILDVVNKLGVYPMIDGTQDTQLTFTSEDMGGNIHRFTSDDFDLTSATTFGARFASLVANNFKLYDAYFLWR